MDRRKTATYISPKIHVDRESGMKPGNIPKKPNFRREPRFQLSPDEGFVEIVHGSRSMRGSLIDISLSGMGFSLDSDPGLEAGAELTGSTVNIGGSVVRGDIILLNMRRGDGPEMRFGALFYPRAGADEKAWFSVVPKPDGERSDAEGTEAGEPILAIRCGSCHRVMCLRESPAAVGLAPTVECWNCTQEHVLPDLGLLRSSSTVKLAREIARSNRIDLSAANSVLLRILTIEQVRDTFDSKPKVEQPAEQTSTSSHDFDIDPGFRPAVQAGTLTVGQAIQRGSRSVFASKLVARHGLSESVALDVADNKIPLIKAVRQRGPREPIRAHRPVTSRSPGRMTLLVTTLALVVLLAGGLATWQEWEALRSSERAAVAERRQRAIKSTSIVRDDVGRMTEISGTDPRDVLVAYCSEVVEGDQPRKPLEVAQPVPPEHGVRLGIFTDPRQRGAKFAIRIERRGGARRWSAGGNGEPVRVIKAPELPPLTPRVPVD